MAPNALDQFHFFFRLLLRMPVWSVAAVVQRFNRSVVLLLPSVNACPADSILPCRLGNLLSLHDFF
jgi:hypothetical protein